AAGSAPGTERAAAPGLDAPRSHGVPGGSLMNGAGDFARTRNGIALPLRDVPELSIADFRRTVLEAVADGGRVSALFGHLDAVSNTVELFAVVADSLRAQLYIGKTRLQSDRYPALTPDCPQVHLFERELAEQYGVFPEGHPWLRPVRYHASYRP